MAYDGFGTATDVVTSGGAPNLPTFAPGGGGGVTGLNYVLLSSQTASNSASINFTSFVSASYEYYVIEMLEVIPVSNNTSIYIQGSSDNGSTYINTNYSWGQGVLYSGNLVFEAGSGTDTQLNVADSLSNSANGSHSGYLTLYNLNNANLFFRYNGFSNQWDASSNLISRWATGGYKVAATLNAFKVFMATGNISSGTFNLYGVQANSGGGLTPRFSSVLSSNQAAVTGDGTVYDIICDSVQSNVGGAYNSGTGVFTANKTGNYQFSGVIGANGYAVANIDTYGAFKYNGNSLEVVLFTDAGKVTANSAGGKSNPYSIILYLTSGDTVSLQYFVSGASKNITVLGNPYLVPGDNLWTSFSGYFIG